MLTKPDTTFEADVAGLEFTGRRFDHRSAYYITGTEGLVLGGTTSYAQVSSRTDGSDGETDLPNIRTDPRIITLTGFAYARTMRGLGQMMDALAGALSENDDADWFTWQEFGERRSAWVRRGRDGAPRRIGATGRMEFTARFRAPSQRVYGELHPRVGPAEQITVTNRGNFHALNVYEVRGNMPNGYQLVSGADVYTVTRALAPGQVDRIDMRDRVVVKNGTPDYGAGFGVIRTPKLGRDAIVTLNTSSGSGQVSCWPEDNYI